MKRLATIAGFAVLAACSGGGTDAPEAEDTPVVAEASGPAVANGSPPGTYIVITPDGAENTSVINADGTFADTAPDGTVTTGTWAVVEGKTCFTAEGEGATPECWTESAPGADGSFTAVSDAGVTVTIKPKPAA